MLGASSGGGVPGVFTNSRHQRLRTLQYSPPRCPPGALLFLHHGLAEHCGRYDKVCRLLADNGVAVYTYDAHGHGKSEPLDPGSRALINSYTHLVDDMCDYMDFVQAGSSGEPAQGSAGPQGPQCQLRPRPPVFLLGHSMGGLVAAMVCLRRQDQVAGLMMHSPSLDVEWTAVLRAQALVGGLLAQVMPRARIVAAVRPEDMSQDPAVVADYVSDPLNTVGPVRARTANEMLRGFAEIRARAPELRLPVYVCHGTHDCTTSASVSRRFVEGPGGVSSFDRLFRSVVGGYHELLHGPEWEDCTMALLQWMRAHGARSGGFEGEGEAPPDGGDVDCAPWLPGAISKL